VPFDDAPQDLETILENIARIERAGLPHDDGRAPLSD
jgi:hypothetical protein